MKKHSNKLYIVLTAGIVLLTGCFSSKYMMPPTELKESDKGPMAVLTQDGTIYSLDYGVVTFETVGGRGVRYSVDGATDSSFWSIPISEIELVQTTRVDIMKSLLLTGVGVLAGAAIASTAAPDAGADADVHLVRPYTGGGGGWGGCPLVYTFDGEDYRLESETFAGAVCQSLEFTNIERLQHLREIDGAYHLVVTNQQPESHFVNELGLLAVDHSPGTQVIPDVTGQIRTVRHPVAPSSAWSLDGKDIIDYVEAVDGRRWESELQAVDLSIEENLRDGLVCEFPKPEGATQAKLIINGKNSTLCNYALAAMFSQGETERLKWFHELNTNAEERDKYIGWIVREGGLDVSVWSDGDWVQQGWFPNVGPHVSAEKMIILDVSTQNTDKIRVKIETARDLWYIDRVAMDFSEDEEITATPMAIHSAITESGLDVSHLLASPDSLYYASMSGEYARIVYKAVPRNPQMERSVVLKSRGYYYRWAQPSEYEISRETIERVLKEPLYGNRFFLPKWREVRAQHTSAGSRKPHFELD
jgi:hypothetical protein